MRALAVDPAEAVMLRLHMREWLVDAPGSRGIPATPPLWTPLPGPQTMALESEADELFYGGAAGGGKTDLLLGLGLAHSERAIIFRREFKQLRGIIDRSREIVGDAGRLNESSLIWRLDGGRVLEFGAVEHEWDARKYQGRPHSKKLFDELPQFSRSQYRFLSGWARTTNPRERVRVVGAGNPPTDADGEWVIEHWGAWLDPQYAHPAAPGELRWYAVVDGEDIEREDGQPFTWKGEMLTPRSRTFIPARLADNPHLLSTGYMTTLQGMPEPLRSQMLYGDFTVGVKDDVWQVIPTAWVRAAQDRWTPNGHKGKPLTSAGFDIAQGGNDETVISRRRGRWYAELEAIPGPDVPDASVNADHVERVLALGGVGYVDSDGIGASTYFLAKPALGHRVQPFKGSAPAVRANGEPIKDSSGVLTFLNVRAAAYWKLREALDPSSPEPIALPPSRDLRVQLCAARYIAEGRVVKLEKKEKIKERLGRSPDEADAVVMATWDDPDAALAEAFARESAPSSSESPLEREMRTRGVPRRRGR